MKSGAIIYEGPSDYDGKPIVVIATGFGRKSQNRKTGAMIQTWILCAEMNPVDAVMCKADSTICGTCPHRGGTCYVNVGQAPLAVWNAYKRGTYGKSLSPVEIITLANGRKVRMGAYGDPAAVPSYVWEALATGASGFTGYTHGWKTRPDLARFCMASVDSPLQAFRAQAVGWRTFRIRHEEADILKGEINCPSDILTCEKCMLCAGTSRPAKNISIPVHGKGAKHFSQ